MNKQEVNKTINHLTVLRRLDSGGKESLYDMAISALEKQIPKKAIEYEDKFYGCPNCDNVLLHKWSEYPRILTPKKHGLPYCLGCGQAIDWSVEEG